MSYKNPSPRRHSRLSTQVRVGVAAVALCFVTSPVLSNPLNPTVVNGTATFNQAGAVLTVTNSNGAIINWDKFSITAGETTHFAQPAASSTVLNRVLNDPSVIFGTLSSNGRVWLVNPAGILVGAGARIDTAGFVASTLNIRNEDFLAGRHLFVNDGNAKDVINQGEIRTPAGGSVYLIGSNVSNEGIIVTPKGETILAAGATVSLIDSATPGVKVDITGAAGNSTNLGEITAEAGRIGIAGVIVRNSGQLNASSVVSEGGRVFLKASQDAYVDGNGRIVTTGTKGGSVEVLGERVAVMDNASIDASGTGNGNAGGGRIMVGGDYQGKNPDIQNANITYFGPKASLKADATGVGDGGTVIVWADDTTRAYGNISARGGAAGGNGGFVETSGKRFLDARGARVNVGASNGKAGIWLLDPSAIDIVSAGTTDTDFLGTGTTEGVFSYGGNVGTIFAGDVSNALSYYGSVIIHTDGAGSGNGNITANGVNINGSGSLTLAAYGGGSATGNVTITGSNINVGSGFKALAGWNGATTYYGSDVISGKGNINISASWIMSNSNVDLHAGNDITLGHTGTSSTGTWIQSNGVMSVSANNLTLYGGSTGIFNISGSQGPGAMLYSAGSQTVTVVNQILLRAGSANNTNPMYGGGTSSGSVGIWSDADQTISANVIKLWAGVSGHDNGAELRAYHDQAINITGTGGLLELKGGGDNSGAVYGGAGSYNNQARIQHGQWVSNDSYTGSGNQIITIDGGGTVNVQAGGGTGVLGYYSNECASATGNPNLCRGSSNGATIENGIGAQTLDYVAGGTLTVTGGSAGTQNWAGVNNKGAGQYIYGNPNITLTGGTGGGAVSYGGEIFNLSNDAGIYSKGSGAQYIYGGSITINAGGDAASYGGAGISNDSGQGLYISTTGTLAMYGGASSAGDIFAGGAYIGNKNGGAIDLQIGGALYIKAGSGTSSPILIGSVDGPGNVNIRTTGNADIIADGSGVAIGSLSASYGATVSISSGGSLTVSGSATRGVLIGSLFDSDAGSIDGNGIAVGSSSRLSANSNLSLLSRNDISIKDTATVKTYGGAITLVAGWDGSMAPVVNRPGSITAYGGFTTDGGAFTAYAGNSIMLGSINTDGVSNYYGYSGGNVNLRADAGFIDVSSISAKGSVPIGSGNSGGWGGSVTLQSFGGLTIGAGGIDSSGGQGSDGYHGGTGGSAGQVMLTSTTGGITVYGNITAKGGAGGDSGGYSSPGTGSGGQGNAVTLNSYGDITMTGRTIDASGGDSGDLAYGYPGSAGSGGQIQMIVAGTGASISLSGSSLISKGGDGGDNHGSGSAAGGGSGGSVVLSAHGGITGGSINTSGGNGGNSIDGGEGAGSGGSGGSAGSINLATTTGNIDYSAGGVVIAANGGNGGHSAASDGGEGGSANTIALTAPAGSLFLGNAQLSANAGNGGNSNTGGYMMGDTWAGSAGSAGPISLSGYGGITMTGGSISANGGNGGNTGYGYAGYASSGGAIQLNSAGSIALTGSTLTAWGGSGGIGWDSGTNGAGGGIISLSSTILGSISLDGTTLNVEGGTGNNGFDWGYSGGSGGSGGTVQLQTVSGSIMLSNGSFILARGGSGGTGASDDPYHSSTASSGGDGGEGGGVTLVAYGPLASISLSGSAITASGGAAGAGGAGTGAYDGYGANGGRGGTGGGVTITSAGSIQSASVYVNGGAAGAGGSGVAVDGDGLVGNVGSGGSVQLTSVYGGSAGGLAISAAVVGSDYLTASASGTYGGISIGNTGLQPTTLSIVDSTSYQSNISFYNSGDLTLNGGQTFTTSGSKKIESGGTLTVATAISAYDVDLRGSTINVGASVTADNNASLGGSTININAAGSVAAGNNVALIAPLTDATTIINVDAPVTADNNAILSGTTININTGGSVAAGNNVALIAPLTGGAINLMGGGVTADGLAATPSSITASNGVVLPYTGIAFVAGKLFADTGGYLKATHTTLGNISGLVTGDITLNDGAYFQAGKDGDLVLAGGTSTLSLLNGGYILASPTTIKLDFPSRSSGGVVISGGGGLFVGSFGNVATAGHGLELTYAPVVLLDNTAINNLNTATNGASSTSTPTDSDVPPPLQSTTGTGGTTTTASLGATTGGTQGTFGSDAGTGGDTTGTGGTTNGDKPPAETKKDGGSTTASSDKDKKDDKKDEKDKKDKKSDEAKDEKKDEKPAQKKVAQCT